MTKMKKSELRGSAAQIAEATAIWNRGVPLPGTPGEIYLGIDWHLADSIPDVLRYLEPQDSHQQPAVVAAIRDLSGRLTGVEVTEWPVVGDLGHARISATKKIIGVMGNGAVQLSLPNGGILFLTVGIEAMQSVFSRWAESVAVWAVIDPARFGKVDLPPDVSEIELFADSKEQFTAVARIAARLKKRGISVTRRWPCPVKGTRSFAGWAEALWWIKEDQDDGWVLGG